MIDKKALILAIKPKGEMVENDEEMENEGEEEMSESSASKETAAEEIIAAIESKDPKALAAAFSNMIQICSEYED